MPYKNKEDEKKWRLRIKKLITQNSRKNKLKIKDKKYYEKNKQQILKKHREYNKKPEVKERRRLYRLKNKEKIARQKKIWKKCQKYKQYKYDKYHNDKRHRLMQNCRTRIYIALKLNRKTEGTIRLIGCSIEYLKKHLESKFTFGMNWKNYGYGWHIDHIKPCTSFDVSNPEQQKECFHYTNLQPLWKLDNIKKGCKVQ